MKHYYRAALDMKRRRGIARNISTPWQCAAIHRDHGLADPLTTPIMAEQLTSLHAAPSPKAMQATDRAGQIEWQSALSCLAFVQAHPSSWLLLDSACQWFLIDCSKFSQVPERSASV